MTLVEPPATVDDNTFEGRVLDVLTDNNMNATLPAGFIDGSDFVDPAKYALWDRVNGSASMTTGDSTADFQALFDHVRDVGLDDLGGVTVLIPKGKYLITGSVVLHSVTTQFKLVVDASNVYIVHKPQGGVATSMFKTELATSDTNAETINDKRDMWTWRGGYYDGDRLAGQVAFEWNCASRMVMERVHISAFDTAIHGRFVLHFKLRDSRISACQTYGVRIEAEDGCWPGRTPANSASNGTVIENVRFSARSTQIAQVRIAHSGHTIRDCTMEGGDLAGVNADGDGGYNIMFQNGNTSVLTSKVENLWCENDPAGGEVFVHTMHEYSVDFQYRTGSKVANVSKSSCCHFWRVPWPQHAVRSTPLYKVDRVSSVDVNIWFHGSGTAGNDDSDGVDVADVDLWENGAYPNAVRADNFKNWQVSGYNNRIYQLDPPSSNSLAVDATAAALWTVKAVIT